MIFRVGLIVQQREADLELRGNAEGAGHTDEQGMKVSAATPLAVAAHRAGTDLIEPPTTCVAKIHGGPRLRRSRMPRSGSYPVSRRDRASLPTMIYAHVLNRGGRRVESPADQLLAGGGSPLSPRPFRGPNGEDE